MTALKSDVDAVRLVLERLASGGICTMAEASRALVGFERLCPVLTGTVEPHQWCECGHEHCTWAATGAVTQECVYVFCTCRKFVSRGLLPPDAEEKERLRRETERARLAWGARQKPPR